ncbi:MAG: 30S ribosomal protein S2 [Planctomycetota bacterium]|nr:MAG: 30S ribosomal protein S2 [Planctomycetota bacterium]
MVTLEELIQAGVHFGHRCSRWNPKMAPYIYGKRNSIHIIDLKETLKGILRSCYFLERVVASGGEILFVGTKPQVKELIKSEAQRCGMHYVSERWLGGTLTNHQTIRKRLARLEELERLERSGDQQHYSKKAISAMNREKKKLLRNLDGIRRMHKLPQAMLIVDPRREESALNEAAKMGIPTVCIIDTDADPTRVDIPIPANDDAYRSVQVILSKLVDAIIRGKTKRNVQSGLAKEGVGVGAPSAAPQPVPASAERSADAGTADAATTAG